MSVGLGGLPDREGKAPDACIMNEKRNVVLLAFTAYKAPDCQKSYGRKHYMALSGKGALQFALKQGFPKENLLTDKAKKIKEWKKDLGTSSVSIEKSRYYWAFFSNRC